MLNISLQETQRVGKLGPPAKVQNLLTGVAFLTSYSLNGMTSDKNRSVLEGKASHMKSLTTLFLWMDRVTHTSKSSSWEGGAGRVGFQGHSELLQQAHGHQGYTDTASTDAASTHAGTDQHTRNKHAKENKQYYIMLYE